MNPMTNPVSPSPFKNIAQRASIPVEEEITHKNILSKRVLQTLNETQKVFPTFKDKFGAS